MFLLYLAYDYGCFILPCVWTLKQLEKNNVVVDWYFGFQTRAYVLELHQLKGNQAGKARGKPTARTSKRKRDADDDIDDEGCGNEPASEEEVISQKGAISKNELKPKSPGKNPNIYIYI